MPGPVSDSYDPEFGTGANAHDVREGIREVTERITEVIALTGNASLKNIVEVAQGESGKEFKVRLTEKELRLIRFSLNSAIDSI